MTPVKTIKISAEDSDALSVWGVGCPPDETCFTFPCRHTPCLDRDYLKNLYDMVFDFEHYSLVWWLWHHPEERHTISDSYRNLFKAKFNRCQRVTDKLPQFQREIHLHAIRSYCGDESLVDLCNYGPFPEVEEAKRIYLEELRGLIDSSNPTVPN